MKKQLKWYSIMNVTGGGLFQDDNIVQAYSSKEAIEKVLNKKVKYLKSDFDLRTANRVWSVFQGNEKGQVYRDYRKRKFYTLYENYK